MWKLARQRDVMKIEMKEIEREEGRESMGKIKKQNLLNYVHVRIYYNESCLFYIIIMYQ